MAKIDQSECKHRWAVISVTGYTAKNLRCPRCQLRKDVPLTPEEVQKMKDQHKREELEMQHIHKLGWAYQRAFYKWDKRPLTAKEMKDARKLTESLNSQYRKGKKKLTVPKFSVSRAGFKYEGYEMMTKMRAFAKRHPEVQLCGCDDSSHCGSMMAFIPHRSDREYWGTTVVVIPQYGRVEEVFFYPEHAVAIEKVLAAFNREWRAKKKTVKEKGYWPKP
jgi:hypothetical protein